MGDLERLCCEMRACACMFTHGGGKFLLGARRKQVHVRTALLPRWYHAATTLSPHSRSNVVLFFGTLCHDNTTSTSIQ